MLSKGSEKRRICNRKDLPMHWWFGLSHRYQDGLAGRDAGFDYHVLSQFQFDASPPQRWYSSEEPWSGITLDLNTKRNVIRINLSGVMLLQIPESIGDLKILTYLDLNYNMLPQIPDSISELKSLMRLEMNHNELAALPESIGELELLTYLDLRDNALVTLPESISKLNSLNWLLISGNPVSSTRDKRDEVIRRFARLRLYMDI